MKLRLTSQDLTDRGSLRGFLKHGRAALRDDNFEAIVRAEWTFGDTFTHVELTIDESVGEATFSVAVPRLAAVWLTARVPRLILDRLPFDYQRDWGGDHRRIGVNVHDGKIWWGLWEDEHSSRNTDPKWMRGSLDIKRMLLGRERVESEQLDVREVTIEMPEGPYRARCELERRRWIRTGLPAVIAERVADERVYVKIDLGQTPVWMPGKGENDYDMGDDGIYATSITASSIEAGVAQFKARVLSERVERCGADRPPLVAVH